MGAFNELIILAMDLGESTPSDINEVLNGCVEVEVDSNEQLAFTVK